jgi:hypothetical protein
MVLITWPPRRTVIVWAFMSTVLTIEEPMVKEASSSLATEWIKGMTLDQALEIKNTQIVEELSLPPVKIHCSVLAEDAIKSAIADYRRKQSGENSQTA